MSLPQGLQLLLRLLSGSAQLCYLLLSLTQFRLVFFAMGQFPIYLRDLGRQPVCLLLFGIGPLLGPLLIFIVERQVQDIPQDLFALAGGLYRELVGPPLEEEGGVDEGLVVHAQQLVDALLGLTDGGSGEGLEATAIKYLEFQLAMPSPTAAALADDPVTLVVQGELELHLHLRLSQVDQLIGAALAIARLSPQCPGHGIQQGGFPMAIVAGQAGQVYPCEIQRLRVSVAHEVV